MRCVELLCSAETRISCEQTAGFVCVFVRYHNNKRKKSISGRFTKVRIFLCGRKMFGITGILLPLVAKVKHSFARIRLPKLIGRISFGAEFVCNSFTQNSTLSFCLFEFSMALIYDCTGKALLGCFFLLLGKVYFLLRSISFFSCHILIKWILFSFR